MATALSRGALVTTAQPAPLASAQSRSAWMPGTGSTEAARLSRNIASLRSRTAVGSGCMSQTIGANRASAVPS